MSMERHGRHEWSESADFVRSRVLPTFPGSSHFIQPVRRPQFVSLLQNSLVDLLRAILSVHCARAAQGPFSYGGRAELGRFFRRAFVSFDSLRPISYDKHFLATFSLLTLSIRFRTTQSFHK